MKKFKRTENVGHISSSSWSPFYAYYMSFQSSGTKMKKLWPLEANRTVKGNFKCEISLLCEIETFSLKFRSPCCMSEIHRHLCLALVWATRRLRHYLPWCHDIHPFPAYGAYPKLATTKDMRALRQLATRFFICGDFLYKRSSNGMLLLCIDRATTDRLMREVHEGVCGPHLGAIDYFTKWVEVASYANLTAAKVAMFIRSHIICRYGIPHELISNRGVHFRGEVDTVVQEYGIQHHRATPFSLVYGMEVVFFVKTKVVHGFSFLHLASSLRLSLSFVFIVSSHLSFVFPCVMMMHSRPNISNQRLSIIFWVFGPYFPLSHSPLPLATRSRVCFDIFLLDKLCLLVEVRDESHNAFSIQSPCLWSTIRDR
ncbi:hypothetical protein AAG906_005901 [Vitis piasezkii]